MTKNLPISVDVIRNEDSLEFSEMENQLTDGVDIERNVLFRESLKSLSESSLAVVKIILNTPAELQTLINGSKKQTLNKSRLKEYLRSIGWRWPKIHETMEEITEFMSKTDE